MKDISVPGPRIETRRGFIVLGLPAEVGWHNYAAIREGLCKALALASGERRRGIVVDFGESILLDASGLVLLARTETRAKLLGCTLRVAVPALSAHVRRALHMTGLARLVPTFRDVASATATPAPGERGVPAVDVARVLDAIRALHPGDSGPGLDPPPADMLISTSEADDGEHTVVELFGVLDRTAVLRLGETLTSLVDENLRHLLVRMNEGVALRFDPLPVLLGIRWRVAAGGGCLSLLDLPARLHEIIDREGLRSAFRACRSVEERLVSVESV